MNKLTEDLTAMIASTIYQIKISKYSPDKNNSPKTNYPTTVLLDNKESPPLEGGNYTKTGGMWNIKHDIISPKFYEILIKTELKWYTALNLNNFYKYIKICLNAVTRLREDRLTSYQSIKWHTYIEGYFVPDRDHPSYICNS